MPNKMTRVISQTTRNRALKILDRAFGFPPATSVAGYLFLKEEKAKANANAQAETEAKK